MTRSLRSRRICFCARATWYLVRARVRARVRVRVRVRGLLLREGGVVLELHLRLLAHEQRDLAHLGQGLGVGVVISRTWARA